MISLLNISKLPIVLFMIWFNLFLENIFFAHKPMAMEYKLIEGTPPSVNMYQKTDKIISATIWYLFKIKDWFRGSPPGKQTVNHLSYH